MCDRERSVTAVMMGRMAQEQGPSLSCVTLVPETTTESVFTRDRVEPLPRADGLTRLPVCSGCSPFECEETRAREEEQKRELTAQLASDPQQ